MTREELGRFVRKIWIEYCIETGRTDRPDRIAPWEEMDDWSREVDMRIGEKIFREGIKAGANSFAELICPTIGD